MIKHLYYSLLVDFIVSSWIDIWKLFTWSFSKMGSRLKSFNFFVGVLDGKGCITACPWRCGAHVMGGMVPHSHIWNMGLKQAWNKVHCWSHALGSWHLDCCAFIKNLSSNHIGLSRLDVKSLPKSNPRFVHDS